MKTANQAVATMKRLHESGKGGFQGWCLKTVREAWGAPPKYPSAIVAWNAVPATQKRHDAKNAPVGALHFFDVGVFGHVVMQSETAGMVWGTDAPTKDKVGLVNINWFAKNWRAKYLGWSTHVNGVDLPCTQLPKKTAKSVVSSVAAKVIPAKTPAATYDHVAAAKGGGVDTVAAAKKPAVKKPAAKKATAKKAVAKPVAKKPAVKKPAAKKAAPKKK